MDEKRIGEIVGKVYQKANESCVSDAKNALAIHVEDEIFKQYKKKISYRTVQRAFERHIYNDKTVSERSPESFNLLCKYLGFNDYQDYVKKNPRTTAGGIDIKSGVIDEPPEGGSGKWRLIITISIAFGAILTTGLIFKDLIINDGKDLTPNNKTADSPFNPDNDKNNCMTWADSLYFAVSCDTGPLSEYGTQVKPLDQMELKSMRKVEVDAAYRFFSDTNEPLIWYYKNKDDAYEYFTAPGLHPKTRETLRKITPHIIQTYVPMHLDKKESFVTE